LVEVLVAKNFRVDLPQFGNVTPKFSKLREYFEKDIELI